MKLADLNNLTLDNIGSWPLPVRVAVAILVFLLILGLGYWQDISSQEEELAKAQNT